MTSVDSGVSTNTTTSNLPANAHQYEDHAGLISAAERFDAALAQHITTATTSSTFVDKTQEESTEVPLDYGASDAYASSTVRSERAFLDSPVTACRTSRGEFEKDLFRKEDIPNAFSGPKTATAGEKNRFAA